MFVSNWDKTFDIETPEGLKDLDEQLKPLLIWDF